MYPTKNVVGFVNRHNTTIPRSIVLVTEFDPNLFSGVSDQETNADVITLDTSRDYYKI